MTAHPLGADVFSMCAQVMRSGPDGALADVGAFIRFAQSNQALSGTLPPEMVHAISKGDAEGLQRMFRCEDHLVGILYSCRPSCW